MTLQNFITDTLSSLAAQIEDQMNSELTRFGDLYCKINLQKVTATGAILPSCSITIFRESFEYSYEMLSSGERALVALVFKLVLNSLKGRADLLFVDEGLDKLDENNRARFLSLLEVSPFQQIFLISHREDLTLLRSSDRLIVKKEHGMSTALSEILS